MKKGRFRKGVFVVAYRLTRGLFGRETIKYLVLKRKLHWKGWEFPKGGINGKESLLEAAKREVKEETGQEGFNFKDYRVSGKYPYPKELSDRKGVEGQTYHLFSCELKSKKVKFDRHEQSSYKWKSLGKALKMITYENQKKSLRIVDKKINKHLKFY